MSRETSLGPVCYRNWRAMLSDRPCTSSYEYPLYTDAVMTGELSGEHHRPYQVINTVPIPKSARYRRPSLILRVDWHEPYSVDDLINPNPRRPRSNDYTGASHWDEIAALISLSLGVRLKAGGETRLFRPDGDPLGRPMAHGLAEDPWPIMHDEEQLLLPAALGEHNLTEMSCPLFLLPSLAPKTATAVVKASRLYQDALWMVESTPELAWILLASAIEVVADDWHDTKEKPSVRLERIHPDLNEYLIQAAGTSVRDKVANHFANLMKSTDKFIEFILAFLPDPPDVRPATIGQILWEKEWMENAARLIYGYRSKALHVGIPFPPPMCAPPMAFGEPLVLAERPFGVGYGLPGAYWREVDLPMHLHVFEYIVRQAILKYWRSSCVENNGA